MKKYLVFASIILSFALIGCGTQQVSADTPARMQVISIDKNGLFSYVVIEDAQTHVEYLAVEYEGGGRATITPLFDSNGKPLVDH